METGNTAAGALTKMAMFSNSWIYYRYDSYCRLSERDVGNILTEKTTYLAGSGSCATTTLPQTFQVTAKDSSTVYAGFQYTYDSVGNITRETNTVDGSYTAYSYDTLGQLRYATDYNSSGTALLRYFYTYDSAGNITSVTQKNGAGTTTLSSVSYGYTDSNWKDLLTSYDGQTITYDNAGNPLSYYNGQSYTMTWRNGRELNTVTTGGKTYSYEYDANGLRTRKTNSDGGYTEYFYVDGLAVAEQRYLSSGSLSYTIRYYYDESSIPVGFGIQYSGTTYWTSYYFAKNLQGDVVALYRSDYNSSTASSYGTLIATYEYDPYGRPLGIYNTSGTEISQTASHVAAFNPFRYRGYRYDGDTGLYYLESRYYDPVIGRFINPDSKYDLDTGLQGYNLFAYCGNQPVNRIDTCGTESVDLIDGDKGSEFLSTDGGGGNGKIGNGGGRGYTSFNAFKSGEGVPPKGYHWHHYVEQCQITKSDFLPEQIHNTSNMVVVEASTHAKISGYYNTTTYPFTQGLSVRNWLAGQPFDAQLEFGKQIAKVFGVG